MLLNNFFYIRSYEAIPDYPGKYIVHIEINDKHAIYEGHFPGMPVTPGVCLVQMVMETAGVILEKKLMMSRADNIKFITILNPLENKEIFLDLLLKPEDSGHWTCEAVTHFEKKVFFKIKAHYSEKE